MKYLETEKEMGKKAGVTIDSPIRIFQLEDIGVDKMSIIRDIAPLYEDFPFDEYDVRRGRIDLLKKFLPEGAEALNNIFESYYSGKVGDEALSEFLNKLKEEEKEAFNNIKPYRRKGLANFLLERDDEDWRLERKTRESFTQAGDDDSDFRKIERKYKEVGDELAGNIEFIKYIKAAAEMVREVKLDIKKLDITCHFTGIVARYDQPGDNSPEGIHQDGADYIVWSMAVTKENTKGAAANIFLGKDKKIFDRELKVGEGVFMADVGTNVWHKITKMFLDNDDKDIIGKRNIIGFDIKVLE